MIDDTVSPVEAALLASHRLLGAPSKHPAARLRAPATPSSHGSWRIEQPSTPRPQMNQPFQGPVTPGGQSSPHTATPRAPRMRSLFKYEPSEPVVPNEGTRTQKAARAADSTPCKPRRGRQKILQLDKVICIPMRVLRAQVDDTSALLRPPLRPSDKLRKLVDLSVQKEIAKLKAPGAEGIMEAAVWVLSKKGRGRNGADTSLGSSKKASRVKKGKRRGATRAK